MTSKDLPTRALAPWFGAARTIAPFVGEELRGCRWVGVPFAGGMSELAEIDAPTIVVSDLHRHIVNLARVVAAPQLRRELSAILKRLPFHPDVLKSAQEYCRANAPAGHHDLQAATEYFICAWMGRSHKAGTVDEFNGGVSRRWNANGGDSNTRFRSALRSLAAFGRIMQRCSFDTLDCFEFLSHVEDAEGHGLYVDAPWPDDGEKYRHSFTERQTEELAAVLGRYHKTRVVIRYGVHPLIERLYPHGTQHPRWHWRRLDGRTQTNSKKPEVLILNGPSRAPAPKGKELF